jgi:hypothetical protein
MLHHILRRPSQCHGLALRCSETGAVIKSLSEDLYMVRSGCFDDEGERYLFLKGV